MTSLTTVLFMQLYRSNLLFSIMRPATEKTPNTLEEVVRAVEKGTFFYEQRARIPTIEGDLRLVLAKHNGIAERTLLSPNVTDSVL